MNELLEEERSQEVRSLVTQLTMSEQAERRRISHILNDDLQQHIYSLIFQLAVLLSSVEAQALDDALAMIDETEQALKLSEEITRSLSVDFSPPVLHNEGLVEAVHWLVSQMWRKHKLVVDVQVEDDLPLVGADLRVLLFQIIRELLFNVIKHAGVLQAVVSLTRTMTISPTHLN
jgi:two-component system, chemotaxis family, CheB/CheR fusion protein